MSGRRTVVVLGSFLASEYYPRWQRQQEFTTCLLRQANVLYVERAAPGVVTPKRVLSRLRKIMRGSESPNGGFPAPPVFVRWVQVPASGDSAWQRSGAAVARAVELAVEQNGWEAPTFAVCGTPTEVWRFALEALGVPYWYDLWERVLASATYATTDRGHMRWIAENAALMTTDTEVGRADWLDVREDILVVPHGAKEWATEPDFSVERDRLYYVGSVNPALDVELLRAAAAQADGLTVIGEDRDGVLGESAEVLGWKGAGEIPRLLSSAFAGLVPYRVDRFGAGVYPTKVYDYLLAGAPVIGTQLPAFSGHPHVRTFAEADELAPAIAWARSLDIEQRRAMRDWALEHGWSRRFEPVRARLEEIVPGLAQGGDVA
jgi:hypothetical protein